MRPILVLLLLMFINCSRTKQDKPVDQVTIDSTTAYDNYEADNSCFYTKINHTISDTYPFNESDRIELVAYEDRYRNGIYDDDLIKNEQFLVTEIKQKHLLTKSQKEDLFSILYNYKGKIDSDSPGPDCYEPHHSIIFYKNNKAIAFLEICFSCNRTKQTNGVNFGQLCEEKICKLQKFFRESNIDQFIIDEMCSYIYSDYHPIIKK